MKLNCVTWIAVTLCAFGASANPDLFMVNNDLRYGELLHWSGCSYNAKNCNLSCIFALTNETQLDVYWTKDDNEEIDTAWNETVGIDGYKLWVSSLAIDANETGVNYTCQSQSGEERRYVHTFVIDGQQSAPQFGTIDGKEVAFKIDGSGTCDIRLTCRVMANPQPIVQWIHYYFNATGLKSEVDIFNTTSINQVQTDVYDYELKIDSFNSSTNGHFECVAINNVGIAHSTTVVPYIEPGAPQLSQTALPVDSILPIYRLTCSSSNGFPAPTMDWDILINNRPANINFTSVYQPSDHGVSTIDFQMDSKYGNSNMTIRCHVSSSYSNFAAVANVGFIASNLSSIVYVKNCTGQDFENNGQCMLECKAYSPRNVTARWRYLSSYNQSDELSYPLSNFSVKATMPNYYVTQLTLKDYRSGFYKCEMEVQGYQMENKFQISTKTGQSLGQLCIVDENCLAFNSKCVDNTCQCTGDYPLPIVDVKTASACLAVSNDGNNHSCSYDSQCNYKQPVKNSYVCVNPGVNGHCECRDVYSYIIETGDIQCITKASHYGPCVFDEQCQMSDDNFYCTSDGYCDCRPGYFYSYPYQYCYNPYGEYLSVSAALGIAFGIILLICIIFVCIIACSRNHIVRRNAAAVAAARSAAASRDRWTESERPTNVEWVHIDQTRVVPYPIENPPSYVDIRRSETPPPTFEDTIELKCDRASVLYLVNDNYRDDPEEEGISNQAMENEV